MVVNVANQDYNQDKAALLEWLKLKKYKPETVQKFRAFFAKAETSEKEYVFTWFGREVLGSHISVQVSFVRLKDAVLRYQLSSGYSMSNGNVTNRSTMAEINGSRVTTAELLERTGNATAEDPNAIYTGSFY